MKKITLFCWNILKKNGYNICNDGFFVCSQLFNFCLFRIAEKEAKHSFAALREFDFYWKTQNFVVDWKKAMLHDNFMKIFSLLLKQFYKMGYYISYNSFFVFLRSTFFSIFVFASLAETNEKFHFVAFRG